MPPSSILLVEHYFTFTYSVFPGNASRMIRAPATRTCANSRAQPTYIVSPLTNPPANRTSTAACTSWLCASTYAAKHPNVSAIA